MPRLIVTEGALTGIVRCRDFLKDNNPLAMQRAAQVILQHFTLLETVPEMGRPLESLPQLRELIIPFGDTGYVALYRFEATEDTVYILAFRHQKEVGY